VTKFQCYEAIEIFGGRIICPETTKRYEA